LKHTAAEDQFSTIGTEGRRKMSYIGQEHRDCDSCFKSITTLSETCAARNVRSKKVIQKEEAIDPSQP
jgi:hypothetical protein